MHDPKGIHDLAARKPQQDAALAAPELTVVIPTFREVANIPLLVERLRETLAGIAWEAVFVDDDSPDGTAAEIRRLGADDARIRCIRRIGRRGLAGACIEGMLASQASYVAVMDADLQHDERLLPAMLAKARAESLDLVVASRYLAGGSAAGLSPARRVLSRFGARLGLALLTDRTVSDPMSGFFLLPRPLFAALAPRLSGRGYKLLLDILASADRPLAIGELAYRFRARHAGASKLDARVLFEFLALIREKHRRRV
jgi:dolichol-phosphate mannosyltransferase